METMHRQRCTFIHYYSCCQSAPM